MEPSQKVDRKGVRTDGTGLGVLGVDDGVGVGIKSADPVCVCVAGYVGACVWADRCFLDGTICECGRLGVRAGAKNIAECGRLGL